MKALIDGDIFKYSVAWAFQRKDEPIGNFESCITLLEEYLRVIVEETESDSFTIYLTMDRALNSRLNKRRAKEGLEAIEYKPNFREAVAVSKPYKGNRKADKPFHLDNLVEYMLANYDCKVAEGMEADDLLAMDHVDTTEDTILCSIDKDLKQVPGLFYSWEQGRIPSFGPVEIDELGWLEKSKKGKVTGVGLKWFYAQMIIGDSTDNIPGVPGKGPAYAYKILDDCESEEELFTSTFKCYFEFVTEDCLKCKEYFQEQADLLWMVRALDEEGEPVRYVMYDER